MKPFAPLDITHDITRRALEALKNTQDLARSPLIALKCVQTASAGLAEKPPLKFGLALRQVLLDAIEQLNPKLANTTFTVGTVGTVGATFEPPKSELDPAWQPYVILTSRFVAPNRYSRYESIANKLAISKSTYYRKLDEAIALLLNVLKRMEIDADADADANVDAAAMSVLLALPPTPNYEYFVGREDLVTRIKNFLSTSQPASLQPHRPSAIGLWGLPGSGKTTLLIQLANDPDIRELFPDGILWGSLGRNPNLAALAQAWCMAMHVTPSRLNQAANVTDKIKLLHDAIANCRILIIVDDVWNADDALPLKVRGPNTALLFSSRFPDIAAALAGPNTFKVNELTEADSLNMLTTYAPFASQCCPDRARSLAVALGGLPLALVIAGQFLQQAGFSNQPRRVQQAFDRLEDALFRLTLPDSSVRVQGDEPSHRTLDAVLAQSIEMLSVRGRQALQSLSLLPQKPNIFSEATALAIVEPDSHLTKQDALDELVNMGLLDVVLGADDIDGSLYSIHQVIMDYAAAECDPREREIVQRRIISHYADALKEVKDCELSNVTLTNLLAAAQLAQKCQHASEAIALALGLYPHLEGLGMWDMSASLLSSLLAHPQARRAPALHADILLKLAHCHRLQKHLAQAEAFAQSVEMLIGQFDATSLLNHAEMSSRVYELQANILMDKGEHRAAILRCTSALEAALEARSPDLVEQARHTLALAFSLSGEYERMAETLEPSTTLRPIQAANLPAVERAQPAWFNRAATAVSQQAHLYHCQARALKAVSLFLQAKLPEAADEARAALDIARKSHNRRWIILTLEWLGWILNTLGQYDEALNLMNEVFSLARNGDFKEDLVFLYVNLSLVAKAHGALDEAEQHLYDALVIANQVAPDHMNGKATLYSTLARIQLANNKFDQAELSAHQSVSVADNNIETIASYALLGYIKARQEKPQESDECFAKALGQGRRLGLVDHTALILFATHYRAESALCLGRHEQAIADFSGAYTIAQRSRSPEALGITAFGLGRACAAAGRLEEAQCHIQTSLSHLQSIGHVYARAAVELSQQVNQGALVSFSGVGYGF